MRNCVRRLLSQNRKRKRTCTICITTGRIGNLSSSRQKMEKKTTVSFIDYFLSSTFFLERENWFWNFEVFGFWSSYEAFMMYSYKIQVIFLSFCEFLLYNAVNSVFCATSFRPYSAQKKSTIPIIDYIYSSVVLCNLIACFLVFKL